MAEKRGPPASSTSDEDGNDTGTAIILKRQKIAADAVILGSITKEGIKRTSNLMAPTMQLTGHAGEVLALQYNPDGDVLASGSFDKEVFLWRAFGENKNYSVLKGHKNAVLELHWFPDGERLVTASADKTMRCWDAVTGTQVKKMTEHDNFVNAVCPLRRGGPMFVSGSDDATVKVWDLRVKRSVQTLNEKLQVCAVAFSEAGDQVYSGGLDNVVKVWDLRKGAVSISLKGHTDTITGLSLSPDGSFLLSNSMDNTLREWDVRPYAPAVRCTKVFTGHMHNFEKQLLRCHWSPDGSQVTAGSGDRNVYVWDASSRKLVYKLPGHTGSVNEVVFHPKEPIIASASSDRTIFLGELML